MNTLNIYDLSYKYPKSNKDVLKNISATFEQGKIHAIMGKSGSGKTTLLSLISGLATFEKGDIMLGEKSIRSINKDKYRSELVGVIFQSYNLIPSMTALENVKLALDISKRNGKNKNEALKLLESVGIDETSAKRKVLKLSGGEQQRVSIARAISNNPGVIIADEPTGNLDEENEANIMQILKRIAKEQNKTVIIVTHSSSVAQYADELYGITKGKLNYVKSS